MRSLAKTRPSPLVVETEVTISRGAFWVLSTVAPPSGKQQQQQQRKFIISMSSNAKAVTLEELQKGGGGSFTILPPVTIAAVGRHRFAYLSCMVCRKKPNPEGCAQHPDADIKARYCLRIQLKQDDISMWVTAFANIAESILGVSVEDFGALTGDQRRTVVFPAIGMKCNMTMRKTVGMYTNYTVESVRLPCE